MASHTSQELLEETLDHRIALMAVAGMNAKTIAVTLNKARIEGAKELTTRNVTYILNGDACKLKIRAIRDEEFSEARATIRRRAGQLAEKAMDVVEQKLDEGDLKAVVHVYRALAIVDELPQENKEPNIQIILPTIEAPDINITPEKKSGGVK